MEYHESGHKRTTCSKRILTLRVYCYLFFVYLRKGVRVGLETLNSKVHPPDI